MENTEHQFFQPWMILLIMPLVGIIGMVIVIVGSESSEPVNNTSAQQQIADNATPVPQTIPPRTLPPTSTSVFNQPVPDAVLYDLEGNQFTLADFEGQIIVLNFWATWCEPCREEMPALQAYYESYEGDDLVIVLVTDPYDAQDQETIESYINELELTLPIGLSEYGQLQNMFGTRMLPTTYFIDSDGVVRGRWIGPIEVENLVAEVENVRTDAS